MRIIQSLESIYSTGFFGHFFFHRVRMMLPQNLTTYLRLFYLFVLFYEVYFFFICLVESKIFYSIKWPELNSSQYSFFFNFILFSHLSLFSFVLNSVLLQISYISNEKIEEKENKFQQTRQVLWGLNRKDIVVPPLTDVADKKRFISIQVCFSTWLYWFISRNCPLSSIFQSFFHPLILSIFIFFPIDIIIQNILLK